MVRGYGNQFGHKRTLCTILSWLHTWLPPRRRSAAGPREHLLLRIFMRKSVLLLTLVVSIAIQAQDLKPIQLPTA